MDLRTRVFVRALVLTLGTHAVVAHSVIGQAGPVRVEVLGVRGEERRNVLATLSIAAAQVEQSVLEARVRRLHDRAPSEISLALQPFGRYRASVESQLTRQGERWTARYTIDPGQRVVVRSITITVAGDGENDPRFARARNTFPLAVGDPLSHAAYELGKNRLMAVAAELGYLDARFTQHELRVDREQYVADVVLQYETGSRFHFGPVSFLQTAVDSALLARFVQFHRGDPFNTRQLLDLQAALGDSPYFARVEVVPRRDLAEGLQVPIEVHLAPRHSQRFQVGGGIGTNTGPRGSAEAEFRRLNRAGHRAELEVGASVIERRIAARYVIPLHYPRTEVFTFTTAYANRTLTTSNSEAVSASLSLGRLRGPWQETFGLTFQHEAYEVGPDTGSANLLFPSASWTLTRADDRIYPTRGHKLRFELQGAKRGAASNVSYFRVRSGAKLVTSIGEHSRLLLRVDAGGIVTSELRNLPPSVRFFAGGDQSVRGYAYQSLGPADSAGDVVGGKVLLTGSIEIERRVLERWGVAAFVDAGNALNEVKFSLEQGVGGGIRWLSPVGLIRVDLAIAVSQPGTPLRIHLVVGPDL